MRQDCGSTRDCYFTECTQGVLLILTGYLLVRLWRLPANTSSAHANSDDFDEMLLIIFPLELHFCVAVGLFLDPKLNSQNRYVSSHTLAK